MRLRLFPTLLALFIGLPLLDTVALVLVGSHLGFWPTVLLVLISGVVGAALAKGQTRSVWASIRRDLSEGRVPSQGLMDAALVFVAGGLLMAPGFLTDFLGLALLIPAARRPLKALVRRRLEGMVVRQYTAYSNAPRFPHEV